MALTYVHIASNILLIGLIYLFDKDVNRLFKEDRKSFLYLCFVIVGSNLIDLDHLFSSPVYKSGRCSINNHFLHSWYTMPVWAIGLLLKNKYIKYFCLSVLLHLFLDWIYCIRI